MGITEQELEAAEERMRARRHTPAFAVSARFDRRASRIVVTLNTGLELAFPPHLAEGLEGATSAELSDMEITPSGLGLYFPRLDADLYIPALLEGVFGSRRWMAAQMGKAGGEARSQAKAAAARANGKLGGRPRKSVNG